MAAQPIHTPGRSFAGSVKAPQDSQAMVCPYVHLLNYCFSLVTFSYTEC